MHRQGTPDIERGRGLWHGRSLRVEQSNHVCPQPVWWWAAVGGSVRGDDYQERQQGSNMQAVFCAGESLFYHSLIRSSMGCLIIQETNRIFLLVGDADSSWRKLPYELQIIR